MTKLLVIFQDTVTKKKLGVGLVFESQILLGNTIALRFTDVVEYLKEKKNKFFNDKICILEYFIVTKFSLDTITITSEELYPVVYYKLDILNFNSHGGINSTLNGVIAVQNLDVFRSYKLDKLRDFLPYIVEKLSDIFFDLDENTVVTIQAIFKPEPDDFVISFDEYFENLTQDQLPELSIEDKHNDTIETNGAILLPDERQISYKTVIITYDNQMVGVCVIQYYLARFFELKFLDKFIIEVYVTKHRQTLTSAQQLALLTSDKTKVNYRFDIGRLILQEFESLLIDVTREQIKVSSTQNTTPITSQTASIVLNSHDLPVRSLGYRNISLFIGNAEFTRIIKYFINPDFDLMQLRDYIVLLVTNGTALEWDKLKDIRLEFGNNLSVDSAQRQIQFMIDVTSEQLLQERINNDIKSTNLIAPASSDYVNANYRVRGIKRTFVPDTQTTPTEVLFSDVFKLRKLDAAPTPRLLEIDLQIKPVTRADIYFVTENNQKMDITLLIINLKNAADQKRLIDTYFPQYLKELKFTNAKITCNVVNELTYDPVLYHGSREEDIDIDYKLLTNFHCRYFRVFFTFGIMLTDGDEIFYAADENPQLNFIYESLSFLQLPYETIQKFVFAAASSKAAKYIKTNIDYIWDKYEKVNYDAFETRLTILYTEQTTTLDDSDEVLFRILPYSPSEADTQSGFYDAVCRIGDKTTIHRYCSFKRSKYKKEKYQTKEPLVPLEVDWDKVTLDLEAFDSYFEGNTESVVDLTNSQIELYESAVDIDQRPKLPKEFIMKVIGTKKYMKADWFKSEFCYVRFVLVNTDKHSLKKQLDLMLKKVKPFLQNTTNLNQLKWVNPVDIDSIFFNEFSFDTNGSARPKLEEHINIDVFKLGAIFLDKYANKALVAKKRFNEPPRSEFGHYFSTRSFTFYAYFLEQIQGYVNANSAALSKEYNDFMYPDRVTITEHAPFDKEYFDITLGEANEIESNELLYFTNKPTYRKKIQHVSLDYMKIERNLRRKPRSFNLLNLFTKEARTPIFFDKFPRNIDNKYRFYEIGNVYFYGVRSTVQSFNTRILKRGDMPISQVGPLGPNAETLPTLFYYDLSFSLFESTRPVYRNGYQLTPICESFSKNIEDNEHDIQTFEFNFFSGEKVSVLGNKVVNEENPFIEFAYSSGWIFNQLMSNIAFNGIIIKFSGFTEVAYSNNIISHPYLDATGHFLVKTIQTLDKGFQTGLLEPNYFSHLRGIHPQENFPNNVLLESDLQNFYKLTIHLKSKKGSIVTKYIFVDDSADEDLTVESDTDDEVVIEQNLLWATLPQEQRQAQEQARIDRRAEREARREQERQIHFQTPNIEGFKDHLADRINLYCERLGIETFRIDFHDWEIFKTEHLLDSSQLNESGFLLII